MSKILRFILPLLLINVGVYAQQNNEEKKQEKPDITFGKVLPEDFNIDKYKIDTTEGAVIIADIGKTVFVGNNKGFLSHLYKRQTRIKILSKKGLEMATHVISLYFNKTKEGLDEERVEGLKASTFNLENGVVNEIKMGKDGVFNEKSEKNHNELKFTLPNVKIGSIIEYSYSINSDFDFNLQPWEFQGAFPVIWSDYTVIIPNFFEYFYLSQKFLPYYLSTNKKAYQTYSVNLKAKNTEDAAEVINIGAQSLESHWIMRDVPALKKEKFITSMDNYTSKVSFQLSGHNFPNQSHEDIMGNWKTASTYLLEKENFGMELNKDNSWLNEDLKAIRMASKGQLEEAKNLYNYIRNRQKSNGIVERYTNQSLKDSYKNKIGSVAETNLLLTAALIHEKIEAHPVILSTRSNGYTSALYPILEQYDYVICQAIIDGKSYLLDASKPYYGFNKLPSECYNGHAEVIDIEPVSINLSADSLQDPLYTTVLLLANEKAGASWTGTITQQLNYEASCSEREIILKSGKEAFLKKEKASFLESSPLLNSVGDFKLENETDNELPIKTSMDFNIKAKEESNLIYFDPIWTSDYNVNPFKSENRQYPVEMPSKPDIIYNFQMEVPDGYQVDELPKSARVNLNENEGFYEYRILQSGKDISLRTHLKLNKANFEPADYNNLRKFFDYIAKKQAEQIVFKKL